MLPLTRATLFGTGFLSHSQMELREESDPWRSPVGSMVPLMGKTI